MTVFDSDSLILQPELDPDHLAEVRHSHYGDLLNGFESG